MYCNVVLHPLLSSELFKAKSDSIHKFEPWIVFNYTLLKIHMHFVITSCIHFVQARSFVPKMVSAEPVFVQCTCKGLRARESIPPGCESIPGLFKRFTNTGSDRCSGRVRWRRRNYSATSPTPLSLRTSWLSWDRGSTYRDSRVSQVSLYSVLYSVHIRYLMDYLAI